ncbi:hypothetical protein AKJ16_DCAP03421 [Drosera capensis]
MKKKMMTTATRWWSWRRWRRGRGGGGGGGERVWETAVELNAEEEEEEEERGVAGRASKPMRLQMQPWQLQFPTSHTPHTVNTLTLTESASQRRFSPLEKRLGKSCSTSIPNSMLDHMESDPIRTSSSAAVPRRNPNARGEEQ